ncbi:MAG: reverse transcriptase [Bacteroidales bacterium]|nr:reverse transcriptase [Bacteroidales bacterium]
MKRYGNLYEKIISLENLRLADERARKGKLKSYGVVRHCRNADANIYALHESLKTMSYKTGKYHIFNIIADNNKERTIYRLPYYPDRIVHHAIMNVLEPIWVSTLIKQTYSCVKNRGIHGAFYDVKKALSDKENTVYCLKIDIRKYYPNIDHEILKEIVRQKIKDPQLLNLLDGIIESAPGLPIGNYLSQYMANLYLSNFDHWLKETKSVKYYFRYADDIVVLHSDKAFLQTLLNEMRAYLRDSLKLEIKSNHQVFPLESRGLDFVGYVFRHTHIKLRKSIKQNFARKVKRAKNFNPETFKQLFCSYQGWATHCNSINLINKLQNNAKSTLRPTAA